MKIIGHRGAAGLALENTAASIKAALETGADTVEIDVRKTKDNQLVLCHDDNLLHIAARPEQVKNLTLRQLRKIDLVDGSRIITLAEALTLIGKKTVIIELKEDGCARLLADLLKKFPTPRVYVASFIISELVVLRDINPRIKLLALEHTKPFDILHLSKIFKLDGLGLNFWLLNPFTYFRAKRHHLIVYVYTVNSRFNMRFIRLLYPRVAICTDYPDLLTGKKLTTKHLKRKFLQSAVRKAPRI